MEFDEIFGQECWKVRGRATWKVRGCWSEGGKEGGRKLE